MRTKNSLINAMMGCLSYGIIMIGSFITRALFTGILGLEMVGIDGTCVQAVNVLGVVELGVGIGIVYKLYRPIAQKDWEQVAIILKFLRNFYLVIGVIVAGLGLSVAYFVVMPMKEKSPEFSELWLIEIFLLYVVDVVVSYIYAHKRTLFIADQKNYVNHVIHIFAQVLMFVFQIAVLKIFASFEAYLLCKIFFRFAENFVISLRFGRNYSYINLKIKKSMPRIERKDLFKNLKALLFHKVAAFSTTAVSSFIIVSALGLRISGIYCNYMLISTALTAVTQQIFDGVSASFGNLLNTESRTKVYNNFNTIYFMNFLMYSFITTAFVCLVTPFIGLWTGEGSAFDMWSAVAIAAYTYIYGMRQSIGMAKVSAGIYDEDKYLAVAGALVTFASSWILAGPLGISGVMIGNIVGILSIPYWVQSYLVYDMIFKKSVWSYHYKFILYTVLTIGYSYLSYLICNWIYNDTVLVSNLAGGLSPMLIKLHVKETSFRADMIARIIVNFFICIVVPNALNIILFCRTEEYKGLSGIAKSFLRKFVKR